MLAEILSSEYLTNRALQEHGFSQSRISRALNALFGPEPDAPDDGDFEEIGDDALVPGGEPAEPDDTLERLAESWEPPIDEPEYVPTRADLDELSRWSAEVEARQREYYDAMDYLDCYDARDDELRYTDEDLQAAGLPVG
jgi:hypothetical protein